MDDGSLYAAGRRQHACFGGRNNPVFRKMGDDLISAVLCAVSSVAELFPKTVLRLFNASEHMMEIGVPAVRFMVVSWIVSIPNLVIASAMQGLSLPRPSTILRKR